MPDSGVTTRLRSRPSAGILRRKAHLERDGLSEPVCLRGKIMKFLPDLIMSATMALIALEIIPLYGGTVAGLFEHIAFNLERIRIKAA
jgi:hypothetical protein